MVGSICLVSSAKYLRAWSAQAICAFSELFAELLEYEPAKKAPNIKTTTPAHIKVFVCNPLISFGLCAIPILKAWNLARMKFSCNAGAFDLKHDLNKRTTSPPETGRPGACGSLDRCAFLGRQT